MIKLGSNHPFDPKKSLITIILFNGAVSNVGAYLVQRKSVEEGKTKKSPEVIWGGYTGSFKCSDKDIFNTAKRVLLEGSGGVTVRKNGLILLAAVKIFNPENRTEVCDKEVFLFATYKQRGLPRDMDEIGPPKLFEAKGLPETEMTPYDGLIIGNALRGKGTLGNVYLTVGSGGTVVIDKDRPKPTVSPKINSRWS